MDMVKKKINNIRSAFRKEHKKVLKSKRSGSSTEELYEPTLWYYKLLLFTASQEEPRMSVSNDDESESEGDDANNEEDVTQHDTQFSPLTEDALQAPSEIYQLSPPQTPHQSSTYSRPSTSRSSNSAKRKKYGQEESIQRFALSWTEKMMNVTVLEKMWPINCAEWTATRKCMLNYYFTVFSSLVFKRNYARNLIYV
ncbi:unnamed protein product [Acanthoscelides obtectus]|uniref:MADF domain-containing protein n=1 Tax=Acanthoscelides obtectus TaxID=200917 RepID=A0A9P0PAQ8_ACAOB|nr:unnamed protein product [Acanthoscelides obtectus]CAK1685444.1 hypothetical protein AOBTE_LOCUS35403 [Acanthoscelides obtectus]